MSLADALGLVLLIERKRPETFEASGRPLGRSFAVETDGVPLADMQILLGAVIRRLASPAGSGLETIATLADRHQPQGRTRRNPRIGRRW